MPTKTTTTARKVSPKKTTSTSAPLDRPKKAPTKTVSKKTTREVPTLWPLQYADNETSFWVTDGKILNSLVALHEALLVMDTATFSHHVTKNKNDFAEWVEQVLGDASCAAALRKAKSVSAAKVVVARSLKGYTY